jgi:hypothetical protein
MGSEVDAAMKVAEKAGKIAMDVAKKVGEKLGGQDSGVAQAVGKAAAPAQNQDQGQGM